MSYISDIQKFNLLTSKSRTFEGWDLEKERNAFVNMSVRYFDWAEFNVAGFMSYLNYLLILSKDKTFFFLDLDISSSNNELDKYVRCFQQYPLIQYAAGISQKEYKTILNKEFIIKDFYHKVENSSVVLRDRYYVVSATCKYAIFPESMNWHIYGEFDTELARLVSKVGLPDDNLFPHAFIPEEEAKQIIASRK